MNKINDFLRGMFTIGSPLCGVTWAVLAVAVAVLLLCIGLWKTLFILAFALVGGALGGIASKKDALRSVINRCFPAKDETIDDYEDLKRK